MPHKSRPSAKTISREFPFVVEILVPEGGLGKKLDRMHEFHRLRGIHNGRPFRGGAKASAIICAGAFATASSPSHLRRSFPALC